MELADEESERVWHGLICLLVKGGTWTRWMLSERLRALVLVQCCVLTITYIMRTALSPTPLPSHILHTPSLSSWQAGSLRTSWTDRQTDISSFFDSRSQLYPYTETPT